MVEYFEKWMNTLYLWDIHNYNGTIRKKQSTFKMKWKNFDRIEENISWEMNLF